MNTTLGEANEIAHTRQIRNVAENLISLCSPLLYVVTSFDLADTLSKDGTL